MKPTQVFFLGNFGVENLGNECTLEAIISNTLKHVPDAQLKCICTIPEDTAARHKIPAFGLLAGLPTWLKSIRSKAHNQMILLQGGISGVPAAPAVQPPQQAVSARDQLSRYGPPVKWLRRLFCRIPAELLHWAKGFRLMRGSHVIIVPGTGIVADYLTGPFGYPYDIFKWSSIAKLCRVRILFVGIGVGPIYHPLSKWFIKTSLRFAEYRSYRDEESKKCMESVGFHTDGDRVCPDLAFSLPREMFLQHPVVRGEKPVVGVGLKDYYGPEKPSNSPDSKSYLDYLNAMAAFVAWLREHQYPVRILIGDILYDSSVVVDFMNLLKERGLVTGKGQIIAEPALTVDELVHQLAATDIVISARFHNLVLALMLNKPVLALSSHAKLDSLMGGLGLEGYCVPLRNLSADILIRQFLRLEEDAERLKPYIQLKAEQYRDAWDEEYTAIFAAQQA